TDCQDPAVLVDPLAPTFDALPRNQRGQLLFCDPAARPLTALPGTGLVEFRSIDAQKAHLTPLNLE
ncbi:MAG: hypothetical protein C0409_14340, partial [Novosphingobium sp.]|nr:hypothetical protein [Novosphingobium sp.]